MTHIETTDPDGNPIASGIDPATGAATGVVVTRPATGGIPDSSGSGLVGGGPTVEEMRAYSHDHLAEMGKGGPTSLSDLKAQIKADADAQIAQIKEAAKNAIDLLDSQPKDANVDVLTGTVSTLTDPDANLHLRHTADEEKAAAADVADTSAPAPKTETPKPDAKKG